MSASQKIAVLDGLLQRVKTNRDVGRVRLQLPFEGGASSSPQADVPVAASTPAEPEAVLTTPVVPAYVDEPVATAEPQVLADERVTHQAASPGEVTIVAVEDVEFANEVVVSEEVVTQPQFDAVTEPRPNVDVAGDIDEPATRRASEPEPKSGPPPLPDSEQKPAFSIEDPSTEVSMISEVAEVTDETDDETGDVDSLTAEVLEKPPTSRPPPLPKQPPTRPEPAAAKPQAALQPPPSPHPAPMIQAAADAGQKVIAPTLVVPQPLEGDVGEFIGELEAMLPTNFGTAVEATLSLEL